MLEYFIKQQEYQTITNRQKQVKYLAKLEVKSLLTMKEIILAREISKDVCD